jgi:transposase
MPSAENAAPVPFAQLDHYAGFDWASDKHDACVVDRAGTIVLELCFEDSAQGWAQFRQRLTSLGKVGVAIETSRGAAVERLLDMGHSVFPMNPKAAERYRDRKAPSGVKDDALDAWSFADALRTDGAGWRPLLPEDPATQLLRLLCRDEIALIEQRTALVLQLRQALHEYYPAALEAFADWTAPSSWEFVVQFPTPAALVGAGKRRWQKFLHAQRLYCPATAERRLEVFARADQFVSPSASVTAAKSLLAVSLARLLRTLELQIKEYRQRIEKAFGDHPDGGLFASLPGGGKKLAPRLLGELGANREVFASAEALQCYAGTAPVTQQSGKRRLVFLRRACNKVLRATVHLWADESRQACAWAEAYYRQKKAQGQSHAQALRCLGQRWLKILWRMWHDRVPYDEALHMKSLARSGSWVVALLPPPTTPPDAVARPVRE